MWLNVELNVLWINLWLCQWHVSFSFWGSYVPYIIWKVLKIFNINYLQICLGTTLQWKGHVHATKKTRFQVTDMLMQQKNKAPLYWFSITLLFSQCYLWWFINFIALWFGQCFICRGLWWLWAHLRTSFH
jgi:hypothetical protein